MKTVLASVFAKYDADMRKTLTDQGFEVIPDLVQETKPEFPTTTTGAADLLAPINDEPEESGIWVNVNLQHDGQARRVVGTSLDFAKFRSKEDREAGKTDPFIESLINTIEKHGVEKCNKSMTFTVTLTKQGESGIAADTDLLASIEKASEESK